MRGDEEGLLSPTSSVASTTFASRVRERRRSSLGPSRVGASTRACFFRAGAAPRAAVSRSQGPRRCAEAGQTLSSMRHAESGSKRRQELGERVRVSPFSTGMVTQPRGQQDDLSGGQPAEEAAEEQEDETRCGRPTESAVSVWRALRLRAVRRRARDEANRRGRARKADAEQPCVAINDAAVIAESAPGNLVAERSFHLVFSSSSSAAAASSKGGLHAIQTRWGDAHKSLETLRTRCAALHADSIVTAAVTTTEGGGGDAARRKVNVASVLYADDTTREISAAAEDWRGLAHDGHAVAVVALAPPGWPRLRHEWRRQRHRRRRRRRPRQQQRGHDEAVQVEYTLSVASSSVAWHQERTEAAGGLGWVKLRSAILKKRLDAAVSLLIKTIEQASGRRLEALESIWVVDHHSRSVAAEDDDGRPVEAEPEFPRFERALSAVFFDDDDDDDDDGGGGGGLGQQQQSRRLRGGHHHHHHHQEESQASPGRRGGLRCPGGFCDWKKAPSSSTTSAALLPSILLGGSNTANSGIVGPSPDKREASSSLKVKVAIARNAIVSARREARTGEALDFWPHSLLLWCLKQSVPPCPPSSSSSSSLTTTTTTAPRPPGVAWKTVLGPKLGVAFPARGTVVAPAQTLTIAWIWRGPPAACGVSIDLFAAQPESGAAAAEILQDVLLVTDRRIAEGATGHSFEWSIPLDVNGSCTAVEWQLRIAAAEPVAEGHEPEVAVSQVFTIDKSCKTTATARRRSRNTTTSMTSSRSSRDLLDDSDDDDVDQHMTRGVVRASSRTLARARRDLIANTNAAQKLALAAAAAPHHDDDDNNNMEDEDTTFSGHRRVQRWDVVHVCIVCSEVYTELNKRRAAWLASADVTPPLLHAECPAVPNRQQRRSCARLAMKSHHSAAVDPLAASVTQLQDKTRREQRNKLHSVSLPELAPRRDSAFVRNMPLAATRLRTETAVHQELRWAAVACDDDDDDDGLEPASLGGAQERERQQQAESPIAVLDRAARKRRPRRKQRGYLGKLHSWQRLLKEQIDLQDEEVDVDGT